MKVTITALALLFTGSAFAQDAKLESFSAKILENARIIAVGCTEITNLNHDDADGGWALVRAANGKNVKMRLVVSRLASPAKEIKLLCTKLRKVRAAGKKVEVIYAERVDNEGKERLDILGTANLNGLESSDI